MSNLRLPSKRGAVYDDQTYDDQRQRRLIALLRAMAARIEALQQDDELLAAGPELLKMMGDARSELFHYEVRCTYDTPEIVENRRIVQEAKQQADHIDFRDSQGFETDDSEDLPWAE